MIPGTKVQLSEFELKELELYIETELSEALDEHAEREARLLEWDRAYVGDPKQIKRTFPWPGAANIEIPIIGITVDSIVARVVNTIFMTDPFWTIRPLRKDTEPIAKPLESYLEWSRKSEFDLYRSVRNNVIEFVKYGWSWYKESWEVYREPSYKPSPDGGIAFDDKIIRRPNIHHILNRDMITQAGVEDETQAEWIAHRIRLTNNQLRLRRRDNVYDIDIDLALRNKEDSNEFHEAMKSSRLASLTAAEKLNVLYEMWMDFPLGHTRIPIPILVVYHRQMKKICRVVYNPYGYRPFRKSKFIEREGRLEGIGIAKRLWQIQEELSTLHRQQIDNHTLANTRFFVGRRNVVRPNTQIWPGRLLLVNDPSKDLVPMQLGDIYQSGGVLESRALAYAERASGVSDYQLGRESSVAGSRATATSTMALIQEGNRRFDLNIRDCRDVLSQVGRDIILLNQMFRSRGMAYMIQGSDGFYTDQALSLPPEFSTAKVAIELTATTATINREMEKQGLLALMGVTTQYYEKLAMAGQAIMNPNIPGDFKELLIREAEGAQYLMKKIAQTFDIKAIDTVVPGLKPDEQRGPGAEGAPSSPTGMPDGSPQDPSMAGLPSTSSNIIQQGLVGSY